MAQARSAAPGPVRTAGRPGAHRAARRGPARGLRGVSQLTCTL